MSRQGESFPDSSSAQNPNLNRRQFLTFLGAVGASLAAGQAESNTAQASLSIRELEGTKSSEEVEKLTSYLETATEQGLMMIARVLANHVTAVITAKHGGNSLSDQDVIDEMRDTPFESLLKLVALEPLLSETVLRAYIPSYFISRHDNKIHWEVGLPIAAIIAFLYTVDVDKSEEDIFQQLKLKKSIPFGQFMAGLFYWYLMREKGLDHAILAHTQNNAVAYAIARALFKKYPPEEAEPKVRKTLDLLG